MGYSLANTLQPPEQPSAGSKLADPSTGLIDFNLYRYAGNDPVNAIDVLGLNLVNQADLTQTVTSGDMTTGTSDSGDDGDLESFYLDPFAVRGDGSGKAPFVDYMPGLTPEFTFDARGFVNVGYNWQNRSIDEMREMFEARYQSQLDRKEVALNTQRQQYSISKARREAGTRLEGDFWGARIDQSLGGRVMNSNGTGTLPRGWTQEQYDRWYGANNSQTGLFSYLRAGYAGAVMGAAAFNDKLLPWLYNNAEKGYYDPDRLDMQFSGLMGQIVQADVFMMLGAAFGGAVHPAGAVGFGEMSLGSQSLISSQLPGHFLELAIQDTVKNQFLSATLGGILNGLAAYSKYEAIRQGWDFTNAYYDYYTTGESQGDE